jgi:hypothetical protein
VGWFLVAATLRPPPGTALVVVRRTARAGLSHPDMRVRYGRPMEPAWDAVRDADDVRVWADVLVPVAGELAGRAAELSAVALEQVRTELPALFPDPDSAEENRGSTEASVRAFAALLAAGADPAGTDLPGATVAYAQASVRRGTALTALMRSYRLTVGVAWKLLFERVAARCADQADLERAGRLVSTWLFGYVDVAMSQAEQLYDDERARWLRSAAASQAETVEALLSGREKDAAQASVRLRYELARHHLGVVAWLDAVDGGDPLAPLEAAVGAVARAAQADAVLVQPLGLLAVAAWLGRVAPFEPARLDDLRIDQQVAPGVQVALGEPAPGIAGFRAGHAEAVHARRVATLAARRPGTVTRFGRVALVAMATADVDQARAFVARELGALAEDDDVARRLVATLRVYLEENAGRSRAAKRLNIHENTVSYRVRQAEELLGRSVEERTLELRVGLALLPVLPAG